MCPSSVIRGDVGGRKEFALVRTMIFSLFFKLTSEFTAVRQLAEQIQLDSVFVI